MINLISKLWTNGNNKSRSLKDISWYWILKHASWFISDSMGNVFLLTVPQRAKPVSINSQSRCFQRMTRTKVFKCSCSLKTLCKLYANLHCICCVQYLNRIHFTKKVSSYFVSSTSVVNWWSTQGAGWTLWAIFHMEEKWGWWGNTNQVSRVFTPAINIQQLQRAFAKDKAKL